MKVVQLLVSDRDFVWYFFDGHDLVVRVEVGKHRQLLVIIMTPYQAYWLTEV
jgi:hypothetical protein